MRFRAAAKPASVRVMTLRRRTLLAAAGLAAGWPGASRGAGARGLVVPLAAEPAGLIPGLSDQPECRLVGTKLYQGLVRFEQPSKPLPDLAASWTVSPDGLTYSFALRPGVTWHDGAPLTAGDVVFSIDRFHRLLSPRTGPALERVVSVRADGPAVAVLVLAAPFPPLLSMLDAISLPIVPRHIHDRPGFGLAIGQDPRLFRPVGTGPYRLTSWLRLTPFDNYAGLTTGLAEITFPVLPDPAARLAATQTGQPVLLAADALAFSAIPRLRQQGLSIAGQAVPNHAVLARLDLNQRTEALADERVRLALAYAIDRAAILREVWDGFGQVATGPVPAFLLRDDTSAPLPAYDPRAAAGRLDEAGLRPDDQGIRLRLRHMATAAEPWPQLAAALRTRLSQIGVELALDTVDAAEWSRRVADQAYETTGMAAEYSAADQLQSAARKKLVDDVAQIWLVEPSIPVAADRRLQAPGGLYGSFAGATISG